MAEARRSARQESLLARTRCFYAEAAHASTRPHCLEVAVVSFGPIALCSMCDAMRSAVGRTEGPRKLPGAQLRALVDAAGALRDAEQRLEEALHGARDAGASWSQVGDALDITRQAAQQRFGTCPPARV